MSQPDFQLIAQQLRQPQGDMGRQMGERMNDSNAFINQLAISHLHLLPHSHILEIGMGNGFFVSAILGQSDTLTYTGCDFSETMVDEATRRNQVFVEQGKARFQVATAARLPFDANTFDVVFTINTLYFWENPSAELLAIRRVLKPGGQLLIGIRTKESMTRMPFTQYGFRLYDGWEVVELLTANGFSVNPLIERDEPLQVVAGQPVEMKTVLVDSIKATEG